ncbi:ABC transporter ATP-binding protein [Microbacterium sp. A84]|uniref:ABC transporter ATP-binding protein n=1 Tax=Microbacterium sp. A84 TaxID=3450715 RepID=UPI003F4237E5
MTLRACDLEVSLERVPIIGGVSLELRQGEILGIIGPNGAGKSTLLRALAGLLTPSRGEVHVDGRPLLSLPPRERAACIAVVAQDSPVAHDLSVRELVLMGRYAYRRRFAPLTAVDDHAVDMALEHAGAVALADRQVAALSGGERQLVQIARALAQGAAHLLLDEPTSALDVHHQLRIFAVLRSQAETGIGIGIVLHDLNEAARHCDRIAVVHGGGLRAIGSPHDILTADMLADVYDIEARVYADEFGYPHIHPLGIRSAVPEHI